MGVFVTVGQAADALGLSTSQVRRLCKAGTLEGAEHWGRDWRIPNEAVARYQATTRKPGPKPKQEQTHD